MMKVNVLSERIFSRDVEWMTIGGTLVGTMLGLIHGWYILKQGSLMKMVLDPYIMVVIGVFFAFIGTWAPCAVDRWINGVKFNPYHPLTHHPLIFLGVLMWHRHLMVSRLSELPPEAYVGMVLVDFLLLGWFIHLVLDVIFREGIPIGLKPLRRKREYSNDITASDRVMNASRLAAFQPSLTWEQFTLSPLRVVLALVLHGVIALAFVIVTWNIPFRF